MITRRTTLLTMLAALATPALAARPQISIKNGVAASGYDVVAYFTESQPVPGSADFSAEWMGETWYFSSAENLAMFQADPESYAPQYGGYCAFAASKGALARSVPEAWTIVEGKLYLNFSLGVRDQWQQDIPGNIALADGFWPGLHG